MPNVKTVEQHCPTHYTSNMWSFNFAFKLVKIEWSYAFSPSFSLARLQVLKSHMLLVATIFGSPAVARFHHRKKFYDCDSKIRSSAKALTNRTFTNTSNYRTLEKKNKEYTIFKDKGKL